MRTRTRNLTNRRAFLTGAGGVAIGLPFLEGLPARSAWAQSETQPVCGFFIMAQNGVIQEEFWPSSTGTLSAESMSGKAVGQLSNHASEILLVNGLSGAGNNHQGCSHAGGCVQALTGIEGNGGNDATSGGPSADVVMANALNSASVESLNLYAGNQNGYIGERCSFNGPGAARPARLNPYTTYQQLVGVGVTDGATMMEGGGNADPMMVNDLLNRKRSINDLVTEEFAALLANPRLSAEDKRRLNTHLEGIRQFEMDLASVSPADDGGGTVGGGGYGCNLTSTTLEGFSKYESGVNYNNSGEQIEELVALHGAAVALTFACGANRAAALQWGSGTDGTVYTTNATGAYNAFHKISHQTNSDSDSGSDAFAKAAHAEIDAIRMGTLSKVIQSFKDYDLLNHCFIMCTNSIAVGTSHSTQNLPIVIAGNAGGRIKQGEYLRLSGTNAPLLASLINASGVPTENFGAGGGRLTEIEA